MRPTCQRAASTEICGSIPEAEAVRSSAGGVSLTFRDDGVGLPDTALANRLSHGIAGMRQRVRALHGEFSIKGTPGKGTTIDVHLPLAET